jgi:leucyl-tRNA synthetase
MQDNSGYNHRRVEQYWQAEWADEQVYRTSNDAEDPTYVLGMFPYPSGELHMGHVRNYTIPDASARYRRMQGDDVLHPMGWDAFGLPAENAAIENDTNPREWTIDCIERMREQLRAMGFGYDWEREITTCEPEYYRWNQWLFNRFAEAGLVEQKSSAVNWCSSCETVLADEQVEGPNEVCWRCDTPVEDRELDQWFLTITDYADELVDTLSDLDGWPENVRAMQREWIGRQKGARVTFDIEGYGPVSVFTTRIDTIHGVTFVALAPDHEISKEIATIDKNVSHFIEEISNQEDDTPQGIETGLTATNPVTDEEVPVYVADFVLSDVGTGALMGVPGHDERDHAFATEKELPIVPVITPNDESVFNVSENAHTDDGILINSGEYTGMESATASEQLIKDIESASEYVQYRLRDWGISRQRYWGTPIPIVHCPECGPVTVPDEDLPVELPEFVATRGNPLNEVEEFVETDCPECGAPASRETDTMDTFVDSSWYFLRFVSPDNEDGPFDTERANDWLPVDQYVGGIEHAVMHLLYARFVTKALSDLGSFSHREPFENLVTQGMVQLDGGKMSKSKGNIVSPQSIVEEYGADTARLFTMQAARPERDFDWRDEGVRSTHAFLQRLYDLVIEYDWSSNRSSRTSRSNKSDPDPAAEYVAHEIDATIMTARDSYESLSFVEGLRETRELVDLLGRYREYTMPYPPAFERGLRVAVKLLSPVTPHVCEELWAEIDGNGDGSGDEFIIETVWPESEYDADYELVRRLVEETRGDIRQIVDVAGIDDPERIEIAIAPEWKHRALEIAIDADGDSVISEIMAEEEFRVHGETAASYAKELQAEHQSLSRTLSPERAYEALRRATWLIQREFDADVRVIRCEDANEDLIRKAIPGRPAIHIE